MVRRPGGSDYGSECGRMLIFGTVCSVSDHLFGRPLVGVPGAASRRSCLISKMTRILASVTAMGALLLVACMPTLTVARHVLLDRVSGPFFKCPRIKSMVSKYCSSVHTGLSIGKQCSTRSHIQYSAFSGEEARWQVPLPANMNAPEKILCAWPR